MKIGILTLTIKTLKIQTIKPAMKVLGIATVATILEIAGLFFIPYYEVFVVFTHLVEVPAMMLVLLWKQKENVGKAIVGGYFYVILINGVVEVLWNLIGHGWGYPLLVLTGNVLCVLLVCFGVQRWQISKGIYPVDIHFPDIIWTARGFYDSGNHFGNGVFADILFYESSLWYDNTSDCPYKFLYSICLSYGACQTDGYG